MPQNSFTASLKVALSAVSTIPFCWMRMGPVVNSNNIGMNFAVLGLVQNSPSILDSHTRYWTMHNNISNNGSGMKFALRVLESMMVSSVVMMELVWAMFRRFAMRPAARSLNSSRTAVYSLSNFAFRDRQRERIFLAAGVSPNAELRLQSCLKVRPCNAAHATALVSYLTIS